ncbi:MAG TPA: hypothetical protein VE261_07210 [Gaiellaceae bacterium]|nr:hypothetical protein [Gaiellaceae bacterium]
MEWIRLFVAVLARHAWRCEIFCQMTTHVHFLVDVFDESLPLGMHRLNTAYALAFNGRHVRRGTLQRARYWSSLKPDAEALLGAYRYIARNPVEEGLTNDPAKWRWSSFATSCGLGDAYPFVDASSVVGELGGRPRALRGLAA